MKYELNNTALDEQSIRSTNWVSGVTGRPESGLAGMRAWMPTRTVPAIGSHIAGLVDLFRSLSKTGTTNAVSTNFSVASLVIGAVAAFLSSEKKECLRWCSR